jgi:CHAD domain-containing protein
MSARFKRRESVRHGFRRIAAEQLDGILADLAGNEGPPDIHNARRRCKLTRALLRLLRQGLEDTDFRAENTRLRNLARSLSAARDAQVRLRTFGQLLALPGAPSAAPYGPLHDWLRREAADARAEMLAPLALARARSGVRRIQARLAHITLAHGGWRLLAAGLRRSYRAARRAFRAAVDTPSDVTHHEWRKRVKDLWNHARLIRGAHSRKLGALIEQLDALGELLGDDHDLAVLRAHLITPAAPRLAAADFAQLDALIAHRRDSLLRVAQKLGVLACGEKPRDFLERIHGWWRAWHK